MSRDTMQQRYRDATYNRAHALAEAGKGSVKAMQYLIRLIDEGETADIRLKAAVHVLNWGIGRPVETQVVQHTGTIDIDNMSDDELEALIASINARVAGDKPANGAGRKANGSSQPH